MNDARLAVEYFHEIPGLGYGNIMWRGKFPMRYGVFPKDHPCSPRNSGSDPQMQFGQSGSLDNFRERGYWASCFPEGDGITMKTLSNQDAQAAARDISECFGWHVTVKRS